MEENDVFVVMNKKCCNKMNKYFYFFCKKGDKF